MLGQDGVWESGEAAAGASFDRVRVAADKLLLSPPKLQSVPECHPPNAKRARLLNCLQMAVSPLILQVWYGKNKTAV
jgi:hypothetical protein